MSLKFWKVGVLKDGQFANILIHGYDIVNKSPRIIFKTDDEDIGEGKKKKKKMMLLIEGIQPKPIDAHYASILWQNHDEQFAVEQATYNSNCSWDEEPTTEDTIAYEYDDIWNTNYVSMQYMNTTIMASSALC
ncbi:hypothetical protein OROMI_025009 [Orobanche minor]